MKKILCLLFMFLIVLFTGCTSKVSNENLNSNSNVVSETKVPYAPTQENFLKILRENKDGKEYLDKYPNTKIIGLKKVTPEQFENLKNQTQYKDLYVDLPQKELYNVDFNGGSQLSLTTIIDLDEGKVVKIYGVYVIGMG